MIKHRDKEPKIKNLKFPICNQKVHYPILLPAKQDSGREDLDMVLTFRISKLNTRETFKVSLPIMTNLPQVLRWEGLGNLLTDTTRGSYQFSRLLWRIAYKWMRHRPPYIHHSLRKTFSYNVWKIPSQTMISHLKIKSNNDPILRSTNSDTLIWHLAAQSFVHKRSLNWEIVQQYVLN